MSAPMWCLSNMVPLKHLLFCILAATSELLIAAAKCLQLLITCGLHPRNFPDTLALLSPIC